MTSTIKAIIGVVLLLIGAWVTWAGYQEGETVTLIMGIASLLGGIAFLLFRSKGRSAALRP